MIHNYMYNRVITMEGIVNGFGILIYIYIYTDVIILYKIILTEWHTGFHLRK